MWPAGGASVLKLTHENVGLWIESFLLVADPPFKMSFKQSEIKT
jgi:hypothetical protein